jgi:hypothetical protein
MVTVLRVMNAECLALDSSRKNIRSIVVSQIWFPVQLSLLKLKTQPPIQWVPGAPFLGIKRPGREADHSPESNAMVKIYGAIPSFYSYLNIIIKMTKMFEELGME